MNLTVKILAGVAVAWMALAPPLFTGGACTGEFEAESAKLAHDQAGPLRTSVDASAYFTARAVPHQVITTEQCRSRKPRFLSRCEDGPLLVAKVPVSNMVCRIYRDDEIAVRLQYDKRDRLARMAMEMNPYRSLPIPGTGIAIHWAR